MNNTLQASLFFCGPLLALQVAVAGDMTYDKFIALAPHEREEVFAKLEPVQKAAIKKRHAERWLASNEGHLRTEQIRTISEAISFITPKLYEDSRDAGMRKREEEIKNRLVCQLGAKSVRSAFTFLEEPEHPDTISDLINSWMSWFTECIAK
jgi:hypothetical protein